MRDKRILVVDDHSRFLEGLRQQLLRAGFRTVMVAARTEIALRIFSEHEPDIALVDIHLGERSTDGLDLLRSFRLREFRGLLPVISADTSFDQFYRALAVGADDYWVKGKDFDPVSQVVDILARPPVSPSDKWRPEILARLGFFRTRGVSRAEIEVMVEYSRDLGRYRTLARRTGRSEPQLRKTLSRIQDKLGVESLGQLGRLLTVCQLMGGHLPRC